MRPRTRRSQGPLDARGERGAVLVPPGDGAALAEGVKRALAAPRPRPYLDDLGWARTFEGEWRVYRELAAA